MTSNRVSSLALLVALALACLFTSVAQAQPKLKAGSYPVGYEGSGSTAKLVIGSHEIVCKGSKTSGEWLAPEASEQTGASTLKLTGCKSSETSCKSEGAAAGEIAMQSKTEDHYTLVGPANKEESLYGLVELTVGASIVCGERKFALSGSLISVLDVTQGKPIPPSESITVEAKGSEGKQEFTTCEEPKALCELGPFLLSGEFEGKPEATVATISYSIKFSTEVTPEG
jgi:hypothetical protein